MKKKELKPIFIIISIILLLIQCLAFYNGGNFHENLFSKFLFHLNHGNVYSFNPGRFIGEFVASQLLALFALITGIVYRKHKSGLTILIISILVIISTFLVIPLSKYSMTYGNKYNSDSENKKHNEDNGLKQLVNEINQHLPTEIDNETTLQKAILSGDNQITYIFKLKNYSSKSITKEIFDSIFSLKVKNISIQAESTKSILKYGITLEYKYYSYDGKYISSILLTPSDLSQEFNEQTVILNTNKSNEILWGTLYTNIDATIIEDYLLKANLQNKNLKHDGVYKIYGDSITLGEYKASSSYYFVNGKLYKKEYNIYKNVNKFLGIEKFLNVYDDIKSMLVAKYGPPNIADNEFEPMGYLGEKYLKNTKSKIMGVYEGYLSLFSEWSIDETNIKLYILLKNNDFETYIKYKTVNTNLLSEVKKESNRQNNL